MTKLQLTTSKSLFLRSSCPITNTLDIVGDKWTLLIIRDLFLGKKCYREMMQSPEGIASNILANRLQRLEKTGFISKRAYQTNPVRYQYLLTNKGQDLLPVLQAITQWAHKHIPEATVFTDVYQNDKT